jgi:AP2-associated kinase
MERMERSRPPSPGPEEETNIESNVDFLRSMEDAEPPKKEKRSSKHFKRGSLSSLGAGTKSILAGKFGDAFKRFEGNSTGPPPVRTPSPLKDLDRRDLTPIPGSETTDGRSDDGQGRDYEDMTPEMRRDHEAHLLAQEEARVAAAQAEYRQRVGQRGAGAPALLPKSIGGVSRAVSIQNKVQNLLDETNRTSATVTRTAQGYGHYADAAAPAPLTRAPTNDGRPSVPRKPVTAAAAAAELTGGQRPATSSGNSPVESSATGRPSTAASSRPMAPPKPTHLGTNNPPGRPASPPKPLLPNSSRGINSPKLRGGQGTNVGGDEALLAVDLPGGQGAALLRMTAGERDDYVRDFQKRFPSLGAIEMVEREVGGGQGGGR